MAEDKVRHIPKENYNRRNRNTANTTPIGEMRGIPISTDIRNGAPAGLDYYHGNDLWEYPAPYKQRLYGGKFEPAGADIIDTNYRQRTMQGEPVRMSEEQAGLYDKYNRMQRMNGGMLKAPMVAVPFGMAMAGQDPVMNTAAGLGMIGVNAMNGLADASMIAQPFMDYADYVQRPEFMDERWQQMQMMGE